MADWGKVLTRGNVEDRRGLSPAVGGISLTGVALLLLFNYLAGGDLTDVLNQLPTTQIQPQQQNLNTSEFEGEDSYEVFASKVLGSNNETFNKLFEERNLVYNPPKLVLFRSATVSGCGTATSQVGPHYCTLDKTIYLDETFFEELTRRFGAQGGDVAEAYVISHEVGHHIQNELELMRSNSIQIELQADCLAGLWANSIKDLNILSPGEIGEAMDAAQAVGDDRIQEKVTGQVDSERWTHGSSAQRLEWFNKGYNGSSLSSCNI
jgi:uncharacterized protein